MSNKEKNLEAGDQVLKGVLRTPLAFVMGGPVGLVVNAAVTAANAKYEIDRENEHKKYLESLKPKHSTFEEVEARHNQRQKLIDEIKESFMSAIKFGRDDCHINSSRNKYCEMSPKVDAPHPEWVWTGDSNIPEDGVSYCLKDFYNIYNKDKNDPSMVKYNLFGTYCYKVNSKPYLVICRMFS